MTVEVLSAGLLLAASATALPSLPRRYIHFAFVFVAFEAYLIVGIRAAWVVAAAGAAGAVVRAAWSRPGSADARQGLDVAISLAATTVASVAGIGVAAGVARSMHVDYPVPVTPLGAALRFFALLTVLFGVVAGFKAAILHVFARVEPSAVSRAGGESSGSLYFGAAVLGAPMHYVSHSLFVFGGVLAWVGAVGWAFLLNAIIAHELDRVRRERGLLQELSRNARLVAVGEVTARMAHQARHQLGLIGIAAHRIGKHASSLVGEPALVVHAELAKLEEVQRELSEMFTNNLRGTGASTGEEPPRSHSPRSNPPRSTEVARSYADVITAVARRLAPLAETRGVRVVVGPLEPAAEVRPLHPESVSHGVFNVLENALVAAASAVRLEAALRGETLVLSVTDDGPGLEPSVLERIAEPFFTTKPQGTGLGLAIARAAMAEEGGALSVANAPAGGCRVELVVSTKALRELDFGPLAGGPDVGKDAIGEARRGDPEHGGHQPPQPWVRRDDR